MKNLHLLPGLVLALSTSCLLLSSGGGETDQTPPPAGLWTEKEHGLYVFVGELEQGMIRVGKRGIQIGGPPPGGRLADSILIPDGKVIIKDGGIEVAGTFNWDPEGVRSVVMVSWTRDSVTLTIKEESRSERFPPGRYRLARRE